MPCVWHGKLAFYIKMPFKVGRLRAMGAFSVNREGVDRAAVNLAVEILSQAERPLVVFPEGATTLPQIDWDPYSMV